MSTRQTKESYNLGLKEEVSKTFLKTVCAYANYIGGEIIFLCELIESKKKTQNEAGAIKKWIQRKEC